MIGLTRKEADCLAFIQAFFVREGVMPTRREIAAGMQYRSTSNTVRLVRGLVARGHLRSLPGRARGLALVKTVCCPSCNHRFGAPARGLMNRDHLRVISNNSAPCAVTQMQTFSFATVEGGLIILHNDQRVTPAEALTEVLRIVKPELRALAGAESGGKARRMLPGDLGGEGLTFEEDPIFAENRHERGYPIERPRPVCAETEGDGS